ncbi:polysaccharide deacetylase family protein [Saccharopolyspora rosea]|uniref:polysaccharide deacetylase family protein n=1 Tax=Saccharopolyspora rosea TaxID=524884 RepID=UPI0021D8552D|nr:polysaccharide deacetylase family protein [Saccharopolyspora rosea]
MYHRITPTPTSVYDRTPQDFRAELERLAAEDYVPVTATDYATGHIDIPAGKHPVVLTFDDGSTSQFTMDGFGERGHWAPRSACCWTWPPEHPDSAWSRRSTCSTRRSASRPRRSLTWLHQHGFFEIGDHTLSHPNLRHLSAAEAQHEIAGMQRIINDALPGVPVRSRGPPVGRAPQDPALASNGSADG